MIPGLKIHMKHPLIPAAGTHRMFRIVADRIEYGLHETDAEHLRILRHENDVTELLESDFVDEFRKTGGAGQVQVAAWLASMPVSAGNHRALPNGGQLYHTLIFSPGTHGIEFKGMNKFGVFL